VRITQNGQVSEIYLNLMADGRIMHRNSIIKMNGWDTDSYLMALTFPESADLSKPENLKQLFIGSGSYLRRDGKPIIHALSKFFTVVDFEGNNRNLQFQGQTCAKVSMFMEKNSGSITVNGEKQHSTYDSSLKMVKFDIQK